MSKIIKINKDKDSGDHFFDLKDFEDLIDIDLIDQYNLERLENGTLSLTFFDKQGNQIPLKKDQNV